MGQEVSRHRPVPSGSADLEKLLPLEVSDEKAAGVLPDFQSEVSHQPPVTAVASKRASIFSKIIAKRRLASRKETHPPEVKTEILEEKAAVTEPPEPASPLLELPSELRDRIYEAALVLPEDFNIHSSGNIAEPALLATCKQIRKEAARIFYTKNQFRFPSCNYEPGPLAQLDSCYKRISDQHSIVIKLTVSPVGEPKWANVKFWLERLHGAEWIMNPGLSDPLKHVSNGGSLEKHLMYLAFKTVLAMRGAPWEKVEPLVEDVHLSLVRLNPAWE